MGEISGLPPMSGESDGDPHTLIDLFCGTGGFSHGFVRDGRFKLIYGIDIDNIASQTARVNHKDSLIETGDITKITFTDLSERLGVDSVDVIIGGPPCQGFSSLRPNRSTNDNDSRNELYSYFIEFVKHFQPNVVVMENVVGLVTHRNGVTLSEVISGFNEIGYAVDWRILNCANFGIPQKRERFVLIGSKTGSNIRFPKPTHHFDGKVVGHRNKTRMILSDPSLPPALTVNSAISDLPPVSRGEQVTHYNPPLNEYQIQRRAGSQELTIHKAANHSDKMMEIIRHAGDNIKSIPSNLITSGFSSCYSRMDGEKPGNTITVKFQSPASNKCIHPVQNRSITPREAARIQSFDDSFEFVGPLTQISNQLGNAVPPLLGNVISKTVIEIMEEIPSVASTQ